MLGPLDCLFGGVCCCVEVSVKQKHSSLHIDRMRLREVAWISCLTVLHEGFQWHNSNSDWCCKATARTAWGPSWVTVWKDDHEFNGLWLKFALSEQTTTKSKSPTCLTVRKEVIDVPAANLFIDCLLATDRDTTGWRLQASLMCVVCGLSSGGMPWQENPRSNRKSCKMLHDFQWFRWDLD